jgi:uncharacterized membrane protein
VNPIVDALMLIFFVLFMIFIFRGYHTQRLEQIDEEMRDEAQEENRPSVPDEKETYPEK